MDGRRISCKRSDLGGNYCRMDHVSLGESDRIRQRHPASAGRRGETRQAREGSTLIWGCFNFHKCPPCSSRISFLGHFRPGSWGNVHICDLNGQAPQAFALFRAAAALTCMLWVESHQRHAGNGALAGGSRYEALLLQYRPQSKDSTRLWVGFSTAKYTNTKERPPLYGGTEPSTVQSLFSSSHFSLIHLIPPFR